MPQSTHHQSQHIACSLKTKSHYDAKFFVTVAIVAASHGKVCITTTLSIQGSKVKFPILWDVS